jgi:hypothetical protein
MPGAGREILPVRQHAGQAGQGQEPPCGGARDPGGGRGAAQGELGLLPGEQPHDGESALQRVQEIRRGRHGPGAGAARVVLAVPVAPSGWQARTGTDADELVCAGTPPGFFAIGQFYAQFPR